MRRLAIVVPTYNRAPSLGRTLASLVGADGDAVARALSAKDDVPAVVVVDNNSNDATPETVASFGPAVRYIQERRQGLSFARNTGIEAARALGSEFVAFIDDDVEAAPDWADSVLRAFETHPEADCVGGRVLPSNPEELPSWLTADHWAPLALQDHGNEPLIFDASRPGRRAVRFPPPSTRALEAAHGQPALPASARRSQAARLPEVSELDLLRHFNRLAHLNYAIDFNF